MIKDRQHRAARAKGGNVPLMLDPKLILDFIHLWHKDPNTPLPEMNLTPGQSHVLTAFIDKEKLKFEKARQLKKAQYKKERYMEKNFVKMTIAELVAVQAEIKTPVMNLMPTMLTGRAPKSYLWNWQRHSPPMLLLKRTLKFLRLKHLLSLLKKIPALLMTIRLLKNM